MLGNVITTLIIIIASVVLGAGVIFFGGTMFGGTTFKVPPQPHATAPIVDKAVSAGNTNCIINLNGTLYLVRDHICIEPVGTILNVTSSYNFTKPGEELRLAK